MPLKIIEGSKLESKIKKNGLTIVNFFAVWCGPCRMLAPILEDVAKEKNVDILKIDRDQDLEIAEKLGAHSIPTTFFYKDGEIVDTIVGFIAKEVLIRKIDSI